jgi:glycosyltransferase involved in cell wall biosynthesis
MAGDISTDDQAQPTGAAAAQPAAVAETSSATAPDTMPDVSIVIPAHNALPELSRALESVAQQTYPRQRIEAIVVDDGSSDGTRSTAEGFARRYPGLFRVTVLDRPSGSPARPRNVGIDQARGTYVFFLDADDWLGPRAVELMVEHARRWGSDVLFVKEVGEGGRRAPVGVYTGDLPEADPFRSRLVWSLAPHKLVRRSLLADHDIRFFEGGMPEDQILVVKACARAECVSVASDYDYYHLCGRASQPSALDTLWDDTAANVAAYGDELAFVQSELAPDGRDVELLTRLFAFDVYHMFKAIASGDPGQAQARLDAAREMLAPYYRTQTAPKGYRARRVVAAGMSGDLDALRRAIRWTDSVLCTGARNVYRSLRGRK